MLKNKPEKLNSLRTGRVIDTLKFVDIQENAGIGGIVKEIGQKVIIKEISKHLFVEDLSEKIFKFRRKYNHEGNFRINQLKKEIMKELLGQNNKKT